jgi:hypothetical protein
LKPADVTALGRQVIGVRAVSPVVSGLEPVSVGPSTVSAEIQGVEPNFQQFTRWQLVRGAFFTQQNDAVFDRVAVIDDTLATRLFQNDASAVGQSVRIRDIPFTVIGIGSGDEQTNVVLVPFHTGQVRLFGPTALNQVVLQLSPTTQATAVGAQVEQLLRQRHSLNSGQPDDFSVSSATVAGDAPSSVAVRIVQLAQEVGCVSKNVCPRGAQT